MKIITLNIWHGGRLWQEAIDFIHTENPDILLMQEVFNGHDKTLEPHFRTVDEFIKLFDFTDYDFAPTKLFVTDFGKVEEGNAIFSKFPIIKRYEPIFFNEPFNDNYEDIPANYASGPSNLQQVTVEVDGKSLDIFNFQGVWDLDGANNSHKRKRMGDLIAAEVAGKQYAILGGDTNAKREAAAIQNIERHMTNVFGDELETSFNVRQKDLKKFPGYATAVVDMLFVSPGITVTGHYCPQANVSDHLPLVAKVNLT